MRGLYCPNCGQEIMEGTKFCPSCGFQFDMSAQSQLSKGPSAALFINKKSEGLALILSFFITGLGHMYVGKVTQGLLLLVLMVVLSAVGGVFFFPLLIALPIVWIYAMYDSYKLTKEYNQYLLKNDGQPPW